MEESLVMLLMRLARYFPLLKLQASQHAFVKIVEWNQAGDVKGKKAVL
jgi:hypothetical protein